MRAVVLVALAVTMVVSKESGTKTGTEPRRALWDEAQREFLCRKQTNSEWIPLLMVAVVPAVVNLLILYLLVLIIAKLRRSAASFDYVNQMHMKLVMTALRLTIPAATVKRHQVKAGSDLAVAVKKRLRANTPSNRSASTAPIVSDPAPFQFLPVEPQPVYPPPAPIPPVNPQQPPFAPPHTPENAPYFTTKNPVPPQQSPAHIQTPSPEQPYFVAKQSAYPAASPQDQPYFTTSKN